MRSKSPQAETQVGDSIGSFANAARSLSRNPLGIIALFLVLVYGFAAQVTVFAGSFSPAEREPLIYFLVFFPVLVLLVFAWLVSQRSTQLYSPGDFKDEANYVKLATAKQPQHAVSASAGQPAVTKQAQAASQQQDFGPVWTPAGAPLFEEFTAQPSPAETTDARPPRRPRKEPAT